MKPFAPAPSSPRRQLGAASVAIAMLLVFILAAAVTAVMNMSGSSVVDAAKNEEQVSALFLAESGLERARGILSTNPASQCNTTAFSNTPFNLGRGTFTYAAPAYTTTPCPGTASTSCCSVEVTGNIGSSSRTLRLDVAIGGGNGSVAGSGGANPTNACTTSPIATSLTNPVNAPAVLLSVFGYRQHVPGGAPLSSRNCTPPAQTVTLNSQNFESNSVVLVGVRGNSYDVAAFGTIPKLLQGLDLASNYSLVSVVFPGVSGVAPVKKDTYWNDLKQRPNNTGTEQVGNITGSTNSGVANNTDTCDTPTSLGIDGTFTPSYHGNEQPCHSWCYGGDTLVFSLAHGGTSATSEVPPGGITFNTGGTPAQNIKMVRQVHQDVPNVINQCGAFGCFLYSDIWYAYNPNLSPTPVASNASSYKGNGNGAIGATFTGSRSDTTLTVTGFSAAAYPAQIISIGDTLGGAGATAGTITAQLASNEPSGVFNLTGPFGGRGTYSTSSSQTLSIQTMTVASTVLNVSQCTICYFQPGAPGDTISGTGFPSRTISSQLAIDITKWPGEVLGGKGRYGISGAATTVASANTLRAGTPGTTIYLPSTESAPTVTTPPTRIAVYSGTGVFVANTTVTAVATQNTATNSFTVSSTPATALDLATLCGGACAFFDGPSLTTSTTSFTVDTGNATENANTHWAGGFTCLSGVDSTHITTPLGGSPTAANWRELVK